MFLPVHNSRFDTGKAQPFRSGLDQLLLVGVDIAGVNFTLSRHLNGGGKSLTPGSRAGIQHLHSRPGARNLYSQPGSWILNIKQAFPKGSKVLQVTCSRQNKAVR